jgi:hypothetical protein
MLLGVSQVARHRRHHHHLDHHCPVDIDIIWAADKQKYMCENMHTQ